MSVSSSRELLSCGFSVRTVIVLHPALPPPIVKDYRKIHKLWIHDITDMTLSSI